MRASFSPVHPALVAGLLAALTQPCVGHSWVENILRIAPNGTMIAPVGYPRGFVPRGPASAFQDDMINYLVPPNDGRPANTIRPTDRLCHPSQKPGSNSQKFPRLAVAQGDFVALRYQENGHVTLPDTNFGKPKNRGTVYIYGVPTSQTTADDKFLDVWGQWNAAGSGGNKKGRLLATRNYDDGQCYQINGLSLSQSRQKQFRKIAKDPMGGDLWCQSDIQLPTDMPAEGYTLVWLWHWPTMDDNNQATDVPSGGAKITQEQFYTTCIDLDVSSEKPVSGGAGNKASVNNFAASFAPDQDLNDAAIKEQLTVGNFQVKVPGVTTVGANKGDNSDGGNGNGSGNGSSPPSNSTSGAGSRPSPTPNASRAPKGGDAGEDGFRTVTVTKTVERGAAQATEPPSQYTSVSARFSSRASRQPSPEPSPPPQTSRSPAAAPTGGAPANRATLAVTGFLPARATAPALRPRAVRRAAGRV